MHQWYVLYLLLSISSNYNVVCDLIINLPPPNISKQCTIAIKHIINIIRINIKYRIHPKMCCVMSHPSNQWQLIQSYYLALQAMFCAAPSNTLAVFLTLKLKHIKTLWRGWNLLPEITLPATQSICMPHLALYYGILHRCKLL